MELQGPIYFQPIKGQQQYILCLIHGMGSKGGSICKSPMRKMETMFTDIVKKSYSWALIWAQSASSMLKASLLYKSFLWKGNILGKCCHCVLLG